jgi:hypothetical protein
VRHVVSRFVTKFLTDCKRKIRKTAFFLVERQTQLFEARMRPFPPPLSLPAGRFVFPPLTKKPESDFESIHANICYPEQ